MITTAATVVAAKSQISCDLSGEAVILNLQSGTYFGLNSVAARVWDLVQKPRTVSEVRDTIFAEYDVPMERCERELLGLLDQLQSKGLIELRNAVA
ncbi:MAG: PqqD family peptide modification chaperone [Acidobacteriota bacterium]|nr:PqqD family peptide modification chaperone [Acidobacteriota bacterium]